MKPILISACSFCLLAVVFGAFGAHALKDRLSPDQLVGWETGVRYQMFHGLALFALAWLMSQGVTAGQAAWLMTGGTVLFSGSIYLLVLGLGQNKVLGPITPLGGLLLIASWVWVFIAVARSGLK